MKFTNAEILSMPERCLHDRHARHAWWRAQTRRLTLALLLVWAMIGDVVDAEIVE